MSTRLSDILFSFYVIFRNNDLSTTILLFVCYPDLLVRFVFYITKV